jgi:ribonuclease HI
MTSSVKIYADGFCLSNPGPGGWGAVLTAEGGHTQEISGGELASTTNNRMELFAAVNRPC